jgi:hypothetical protein
MATAVDPSVPPGGTGCSECDAAGGWWVHLRRCATCGDVGCCDDPLSRHATQHWQKTGHPIIRSFEPGEDWFWNYETNDYYDGPELAPPVCHPADQTVLAVECRATGPNCSVGETANARSDPGPRGPID